METTWNRLLELRGTRGRYKRVFDLMLLVMVHLLPFSLPVMALLWLLIPLAIKLDDGGPVFYRQKRLGKGGRLFTMLKFRTMRNDAEKNTGAVWASLNDARITRVGRFLRWTALDELPQLLNVLRGEMSLVGPRPERPELHEKIAREAPEFDLRLLVPPGLTGVAQVNGAYNLHPIEKLRFDLEYVQKMSPWLDMKLVLVSVLKTMLANWDHPEESKPKPDEVVHRSFGD